jgi:hypothetical protein
MNGSEATMTGLAVEAAGDAPDEVVGGPCFYDQQWRFILSIDWGATLGLGKGASLADVRAVIHQTLGGAQPGDVAWLTRSPARLLAWGLLWSAQRARQAEKPEKGPLGVTRNLLGLMIDVAVASDEKEAASLWDEAWREMRALVAHVCQTTSGSDPLTTLRAGRHELWKIC